MDNNNVINVDSDEDIDYVPSTPQHGNSIPSSPRTTAAEMVFFNGISTQYVEDLKTCLRGETGRIVQNSLQTTKRYTQALANLRESRCKAAKDLREMHKYVLPALAQEITSLKRQLRKAKALSHGACSICDGNSIRDHVFGHCGHVYCRECCNRSRLCPQCRGPKQIRRIFFP